jgi:hypothetical protein
MSPILSPGPRCLSLLLAVLALSMPARGAAETGASPPRPPTTEERTRYPWLSADLSIRPLAEALPPPPGYTRVPLAEGSFGAWLRGLPLRPAGAPVRVYSGEELLSGEDARVAAVAELDVGPANLQQCADSIIRLHAEWLWAQGRRERITYRFTSGHPAAWARYAAGERARVSGRKVTWVAGGRKDSSRTAFRAYLDLVFTYAGTLSLAAEPRRPSAQEVRPGDFFVLGGSPGHAVLVLDVARNASGERVALLGQGFLPAQDFHVLAPGTDGPWFSLETSEVATPFWKPFPWSALRRLPE